MRSKSPFTIVLIGIFAMIALGVMALYLVESNPMVSRLLALREDLKKKFKFSQVSILLEQEGPERGTIVAYEPTEKLEKLSFDKRAFKIAKYIFTYKGREGRVIWKMPRTFVIVEELKPGTKEVVQSKKIHYQTLVYRRKRAYYQKELARFITAKFKGEIKVEIEPYKKGWHGRAYLKIPYEQGQSIDDLQKTARRVLKRVRSYKKVFVSHLKEFKIEAVYVKDGQVLGGGKATTTFRPGIVYPNKKKGDE